jgi:hypothetical protein
MTNTNERGGGGEVLLTVFASKLLSFHVQFVRPSGSVVKRFWDFLRPINYLT